MDSPSSKRFDVLVVGAGPAGIAAAVTASACGANVGLVDDNAAVGGQIWRGEVQKTTAAESREWLEKLRGSSVTVIPQTRVFHQPAPGILVAETPADAVELRYSTLVLATGARERFLPFLGWTLPNVMGAGGLQALVKSGLPIAGKRVVIAGTGPLLLAVAAYLRNQGAEVPIIAEQASRSRLLQFGAVLLTQPGKLVQAFQFRRDLRATRLVANSWPTAAHGKDKLQSVTLSVNGDPQTLACDYLACGFHLVPNTELACFLGCELESGFIQVDDYQETSVKGIYCAGEPAGIGGLEWSLVQGRIAGLAAAGQAGKAGPLLRKRNRLKGFVRGLERAFQLRPELRSLAGPETILCRCEDVRLGQARQYTSWRAAKLQTRCGMGPCQGRICGPATEFLFQWRPESVRPPVFPARLNALAAAAGQYENVNAASNEIETQ